MGLRYSAQPEWNLFVTVDLMPNFLSVIMAFHEDLEQEATTVLPALPIIIEAKYVFLMTEVGLCWRKVGNKNQW
jgi:hypothetical protein